MITEASISGFGQHGNQTKENCHFYFSLRERQVGLSSVSKSLKYEAPFLLLKVFIWY